ncbi:MAG: hypothetical protein VXY11_06080 [Candidatus Thermoplasmatota archaeon]|nr:hypothetical protein [Candidatus Thermoplasmatota archaeon]
MSNVLPFETTDLPPEDEEEIDPFAELEVGTKSSYRGGNDALSLFEEENDPLAVFTEDDDPLSSFADEDDTPIEETVISFTDKEVPELKTGAPESNPSEATYKLLLETVWVDDILDPSEVELLARKRRELGLSFERHLQLVRDIIGG